MKKESSLQRLMTYAGNYKILTYLSWILSASSSIVALVPYIYIYKIIEEVLKVAPNLNEATHLQSYGWNALLYTLLSMGMYIVALMCSHISAFRVAANIKREILQHIAKLPLGAIDIFGSGKVRKIIDDSSAATEGYLAHQLPDKAGAIATPFGLLALLFFFDWKLGILSLTPVIIAFGIMATMTGKRMEKQMAKYQNALEDMSNEAVEYIRGIPVVKTFGQTIFTFKRFKESIDRYKTWVIKYTMELRQPMMIYTTVINSVFAVLITVALFVTTDKIDQQFLLNLMYYIIITPIISVTLTKIMFMSENQMVVKDALTRIDSILVLEILKTKDNEVSIDKPQIEFEHATFSYDGKTNAIEDINMLIENSQMVALVGRSGGGKTTLAHLTSRFFDLTEGKIKINGIDIRDIPNSQLMDMVAFVFQDSKLLKMSIFDNLKLAKPDASIEDIQKALEMAQCQEIIEKLPEGVYTKIGSKGVYLSGGQLQRIAIARMILKDAPIIVLDEATAFADPDNEVKIQKALSKLIKNKTVIMIAHRLSTIKNVDKIFVLQAGKIVEQGSHEELLKQNKVYYQMWQEYNKTAKWKVAKEGAK